MRAIRSLFMNSSDRFTVMNCMRMSNRSGDLEIDQACSSVSDKCDASNEHSRDENNNRSLHKFRRAKSSFSCEYRFTIKNKVAERIAAIILNLAGKRRTEILIEANAGVGKITKYILRLSSKRLIIYDKVLHPDLQALLNVYPSRVQRYDKNLIGVTNFGPASEHFSEIKVFSDKHALMFGIGPTRLYFRYFVNLLLLNSEFCKETTFIFAISDKVLRCLTSLTHKYSKMEDCIMIRMMFRMNILDKFPMTSFLPPCTDSNYFFLVKMRRNKQMPMSWVECRQFKRFLRLLGRTKYSPVIKTIEKLYPGFGLKLIAEGLSVTTHVSELSPREILKLFRIVQTVPGYEEPFNIIFEDEA